MRTLTAVALAIATIVAAGCGTKQEEHRLSVDLKPKIERFAPTLITGDTTRLSPGDRAAVRTLVEAARIMDRLYLRQSWSGSEELLEKLRTDTSPEGQQRLQYFMINMGPWSELDHDEPFIDGVPKRPPQANYYPADMTEEEFTTWLATLPEEEQKKATGFFTTIRRNTQGTLTAVPYSEEYKDLLEPAAQLLRQAADQTDDTTLRAFLLARADAFLSNDYYASDVAWMKLDSPVDATIGPYEVYLDGLFNYKASFEAFITLRNEEETAKLSMFSSRLQEIEDNLPIEKRYRNPKLGTMAPIRVVDQVGIGGEARAGVQTAAFNLPNDEQITATYGSKRVMLKNVQEAKFQKILIPIAGVALDPAQQSLVSFDMFFTHILAHELMHGLGPHTITVSGKSTTVRQAMRELSSPLEEAKADIAGLFALQFLMDRGILPRNQEQQLYITFLAGVFRSVRFGINEAHGSGMALQFNYLLDEGAFVYNEASGRFSVDLPKMKEGVRKLTGEIMTIQAEGSYDRAKALLEKYAIIRPPMRKVLDKLAAVPVDIAPHLPLAP